MATQKKFNEFEIPKVIIDAISAYLGVRKVNKLTQLQRQEIYDAAQSCARRISPVLDPEDKKQNDGSPS